MIDANETKRQKAAALRYKKPVSKGLNLDEIYQNLMDIVEECDNVRWYFEGDDETLINALDGDEEEAHEFKMMFADLSAECEQLQEDMQEMLWHDEMKEAFNIWFPAIDKGDTLGWDRFETDYMPISDLYQSDYAHDEAKKKVLRMTKEKLLETGMYSFRIIREYLGLMHRYDSLKAAMDILRDQNTGHLQMVKQIEEVYEKASERGFLTWYPEVVEYYRLLDCMPQEAWIQ